MKLFIYMMLLFPTLLSAGESNSIIGTITDSETGEGIGFAYIHLEEIHRTSVADIDGKFEISNIPNGVYNLTVHRLGYKTKSIEVNVGLNDSEELELNIELTPSLLSSQAIEVTGDRENTSGSNLEHASRKVLGSDLRRDLGSTLSQTLSNLPGFDQRTNGSAPGRPVIRGLGDERVVILQDGITSGDVSAQSSDHAVTIDPVSAQEIEIARGPAALAYGANAIGGVINVVRNQVATSLPSKLNGSLTLSGETVNTGASGALTATFPVKDLAITFDLNGRLAGDTETPPGTLDNSSFKTTNDAIGVSWIKDWGYIGGSFGTYLSEYGIPPDPNGHDQGVDIEVRKFQYVLKSEIILNQSLFKTIETDFSVKNYNHKEFESANVVGTEFGLVTTNLDINSRYGKLGFLEKGNIGFSAEMEDYAVSGAGTPPSNSYKVGAFVIEESDFNKLHLEAGLRFDLVTNKPKEEDPNSTIGNIRTRSFPALSGSVSAIYGIGKGFSVGATALYSFRAPSLEELYSEGPHLASYSYEIGNPELDPERGLAKELFIRYKGAKSLFEITGYHNGFSNYLYAQNTGQANSRFPDLNNYQFVGTTADLYGFEIYGETQFMGHFVLDGSLTYTIGERDSSYTQNGSEVTVTRPLPQIPPLKFKTGLKYVNDGFEVGTKIRIAAEQDRLGEFETSTDGYVLVDAFAQYRISKGKLLHTFSLNVNNMLNETWYNHLSRIKDIRPEPARNISLLYRVFF